MLRNSLKLIFTFDEPQREPRRRDFVLDFRFHYRLHNLQLRRGSEVGSRKNKTNKRMNISFYVRLREARATHEQTSSNRIFQFKAFFDQSRAKTRALAVDSLGVDHNSEANETQNLLGHPRWSEGKIADRELLNKCFDPIWLCPIRFFR